MASRHEAPARPAPRLYLVTARLDDAGAQQRALERALTAGDVAAVLLRLPEGDERGLINFAKVVAPTVQQRGAALLLDGNAELAARAGADGAHLAGIDAFNAAVGSLKPARIAGAGALRTRHDAMLAAAEGGADYVMFGDPDVSGRRPSFEQVIERVSWWSHLFEVPCVGYATDLDEAEAVAKAGAEFVALGEFVWNHGADPAALVASAAGRLHPMELV